MAGTGSKQEEQIITSMIDETTGRKIIYLPFKGGGDVAAQLFGGHVNSTVNNPIEAEAHWRGGKLCPLCIMDTEKPPCTEKGTRTQSRADIPT
jgi:putative tricarboxylic transport membrane protein